MPKRKWNESQLRRAVHESKSVTEVIKRLGMAVSGSNAHNISRNIKKFGMETSHFDSLYWHKRNGIATSKMSNEDIFVKGGTTSRNFIRKRIIKDNLLEYKCSKCNINEWLGEELILHLDHINGDRYDNRLENLRWLCPNCHTQTSTWGQKKKGRKCVDCGGPISHSSSGRCRVCSNKHNGKNQPTRINWPKTSELIRMTQETSFLEVSRKLGVSDNAIRKRIRNHPND